MRTVCVALVGLAVTGLSFPYSLPAQETLLLAVGAGISDVAASNRTGGRPLGPVLSAEASISIRDLLHLGVFADQDSIGVENEGSSTARSAGLNLRIRMSSLEESNLFLHIKGGLVWPGAIKSAPVLLGLGAAYELPLQKPLSVMLYLDYRTLQTYLNNRDTKVDALTGVASFLVRI